MMRNSTSGHGDAAGRALRKLRSRAGALLAVQAVLAGVALVSLVGCASAPPAAPATATLRLIAFNDFHGNLEAGALSLPWPDPQDPARPRRLSAGGAAHLAGLVQALRDGAAHSLVISSGDLFGATPLVSALFRHEPTIDIANRIGVDLAIPGNHEFDAGQDELQRVLRGGCPATGAATAPSPDGPAVATATPAATPKVAPTAAPTAPSMAPPMAPQMAASAACALGPHAGARFPTFVANVRRDDGAPLFPASVVREVDGVRVGFIGAVTRTTPTIVVPSGVAGLQFLDEVQAINAEADRLVASGVRALVAVIHEGGATGAPGQPLEWNDAACPQPRGPIFDIVRQLHPRIGIVLSAHTHQGYRCVIDGRAVMQATALGRGVSVADLVIDRASGSIDRLRTRHRNLPVFNAGSDAALREAIIEAEPQPWATALKNAQGSAAIAARVAEVAAAVSPLARRRIGSIGGSFDRSGAADNAAGRLVADAQHRATREPDHGGAELALTNPGGVRTDLLCRQTPPCEVSYGDAFSMQPFGNSLVVMTLKGSELIELLESQQPPGRASPRFLQPSASLTYTWRAAAPAGRRVQDVRIGGRLLDPQRDVRLTVNSFLAEGGDGFEVLPRGRSRLGGVLELDALAAHLADGATPDPVARITMAE